MNIFKYIRCKILIIGSEEQVVGETTQVQSRDSNDSQSGMQTFTSVDTRAATQTLIKLKSTTGTQTGEDRQYQAKFKFKKKINVSPSMRLNRLPLNFERMLASSLFILLISASLLLPGNRRECFCMLLHNAVMTPGIQALLLICVPIAVTFSVLSCDRLVLGL